MIAAMPVTEPIFAPRRMCVKSPLRAASETRDSTGSARPTEQLLLGANEAEPRVSVPRWRQAG
jgi:hypothetical protein